MNQYVNHVLQVTPLLLKTTHSLKFKWILTAGDAGANSGKQVKLDPELTEAEGNITTI
jgi:hypothetical protein